MDVTLSYIQDLTVLKRHFIYVWSRVLTGWTQERRYLVLPRIIPGLINSVVIFDGELINDEVLKKKLSKLPHIPFLNDIDNLDIDLDRLKLSKEQLTYDVSGRFPNFTKDYVMQIIEWFKETFGLEYKKIKIEILPVRFGAMNTSLVMNQDDGTLYLYHTIREDGNEAYLVENLIFSLVLAKAGYKYMSDPILWRSHEEIGNFILDHGTFPKKIDMNQHKKLLEELLSDPYQQVNYREVNYRVESQKFLKKIDCPPLVQSLSSKWDFQDAHFSHDEYVIAKFLYDHKGEVKTYDEISEQLYKDEYTEKFSLEYLTKLVQEIRLKLKYSGIGNNVIFNKRGVGYGWFE